MKFYLGIGGDIRRSEMHSRECKHGTKHRRQLCPTSGNHEQLLGEYPMVRYDVHGKHDPHCHHRHARIRINRDHWRRGRTQQSSVAFSNHKAGAEYSTRSSTGYKNLSSPLRVAYPPTSNLLVLPHATPSEPNNPRPRTTSKAKSNPK